MGIKYAKDISKLPEELKKSLEKANVFYSIDYMNYVLSFGNKTVYLYDENYILLCVITNKLFFTYGYLPIEPYVWNSSINNKELSFLNECITLLKNDFKLMWLNEPETAAVFKVTPLDSIRIPFGNYIINLNNSEEELWYKIHSKHRNVIRKAEKENVMVKYGGIELLNDFYGLDAETRKRSHMVIEKKEFYHKICNSLNDKFIIFVSYKDGQPQGAALFYYNLNTCYYIYGASRNSLVTGAMNLLHWKAILYMKSLGVGYYNFVGCRIREDENSKYHGIQRFKARFGGELNECYLFKCIFNYKYYRLYTMLKKLKAIVHKVKYNGDIIDQEIYKWKEINDEVLLNALYKLDSRS